MECFNRATALECIRNAVSHQEQSISMVKRLLKHDEGLNTMDTEDLQGPQ
jgi:hypothetical protein